MKILDKFRLKQLEKPKPFPLARDLMELEQQQNTGYLSVQSRAGWQAKIYLSNGKIVWAKGGIHPQRLWQRQLLRYFPSDHQRDSKGLGMSKQIDCPNYYFLKMARKLDRIHPKALLALISRQINEILFDLYQENCHDNLEYSVFNSCGDNLHRVGGNDPLTLISINCALKQTEMDWGKWYQQGLAQISPNSAPTLQKPEKLQQRLSKSSYESLVNLIDGKNTIRDLGLTINREVLPLTSALLPYIHQGFIQLETIGDQAGLGCQVPNTGLNGAIASGENAIVRPLIACVDDTTVIRKTMAKIAQLGDYRFIAIAEAVQAVPTLMLANPDLIFLDIDMPVINGYEICSQLRRIDKFQSIPIVMLTSKEGIIDRFIAKINGATDFITKPPEIERILETMTKFCG